MEFHQGLIIFQGDAELPSPAHGARSGPLESNPVHCQDIFTNTPGRPVVVALSGPYGAK